MAKSKINKNRNVGFIYEALTREIARASIEGDKVKQDSGLHAAKVFFAEGTNLKKVLDLYHALLETRGADEAMARRMLNEVYKVFADFVDKNELEREQDELLDYINQSFDKKKMFMNFVPNYKSLATISQLLGGNLKIKRKIVLEDSLVRMMVLPDEKLEDEKLEAMDSLALGIYIDSFNEKYTDKLLPEQRRLLGHYITSVSDNGASLRIFAADEIARIREGIGTALKMPDVSDDKDMMAGLLEIEKICDSYGKKPLSEEVISEIMRLQGLINEVNLDDSKSNN